jgi:hypothetical protein
MWHQNGLGVQGFPVGEFETIGGTPTLADVNEDGALEILFWAALPGGREPGIYGYNFQGQPLDRYPLRTDMGHPSAGPIVADVAGSPQPEIIFGTFDPEGGCKIYVWETNGQLLNNFPIETGAPSIMGSVIVADVSGDGRNDIIAALAPREDETGTIAAWDDRAQMVDGFPLTLDEYGGGGFAGAPTIFDLDRDGDLDLIAVTTNRRLIVWDTPGTVQWDQWPTLHGGMSRNSIRPLDDWRTVREDVEYLPQELYLSAFPNPFNRYLSLHFPLNSMDHSSLELFDVMGRPLGVIQQAPPGSGVARFVLDAGRFNLTAGSYIIGLEQGRSRRETIIQYLP